MRRIALATLCLLACKGTTPPGGSGPPGGVVVYHATYDTHSDTPPAIKDKCKFHENLATAVAGATPGATVSTGSSTLVLSLVVVTMRGVEPTWEGDTSVIVRGELRDGGTMTGSFRIKHSASPGVVGGPAGRCQALDDIAQYMAEDIAPWLSKPEAGTKMGE